MVEINDLNGLKSIGDFEKGILYAMDYDIEKLKSLSIEKLRAIRGLEERAEDLYRELHPEETVSSEEKVEEEVEESKAEEVSKDEMLIFLKNLPDITHTLAERMYEHGITSPEVLKTMRVEDLIEIDGISKSHAIRIVEAINRPTPEIEEENEIPMEKGKEEGPGIIDRIKSIFKSWFGSKEEKEESPGQVAEEDATPAEVETMEKEVVTEEKEEVKEENPTEDSEEKSEESETGGNEIPEVVPPEVEKAKEEFLSIEGISEDIALALAKAGYRSKDELKMLEPQDLQLVEGIGKEKAEEVYGIIKNALQE